MNKRFLEAGAKGVKNAKFRDVDAVVLDGLSHRDLDRSWAYFFLT